MIAFPPYEAQTLLPNIEVAYLGKGGELIEVPEDKVVAVVKEIQRSAGEARGVLVEDYEDEEEWWGEYTTPITRIIDEEAEFRNFLYALTTERAINLPQPAG